MRTYTVYILSNTSRILYIGVTGDLDRLLREHKKKLIAGFTRRYNLHSLVYFELFANVKAAIAREKELKRWGRPKKLALVRSTNPNWTDLAADHFKKANTTKTAAPARPSTSGSAAPAH